MIHRYIVTMRHDDGTVEIMTTASSPEQARRQVADAEGAPLRAAVDVHPANH